MGLLESLLSSGNLGSVASLVAKNPQILAAAASMLSTNDASVGGTGDREQTDRSGRASGRVR